MSVCLVEVGSNQNLILRVGGAAGGVLCVLLLGIIRNFYKGSDLGPTKYVQLQWLTRLWLSKTLKQITAKKYGEIIVNKTKPDLQSASSINNRNISGCEGNWDML